MLLSQLTTLRLGGPAGRYVEALSEDAIVHEARGERVLVIGGGSNVVVADEGWDGTVLKIASRGVERDGDLFHVQAGEPWSELVERFVSEGYAGVECLAGIPGLVGATPMQNVGAYGQEIGSVITSVRAFDRSTGSIVEVPRAACNFAYRSSVFRGSDRWVITQVSLRLRPSALSEPVRYAELARALGVLEGERAPLGAVHATVIALRRSKGMVLDPSDPESVSAGSFFTNPIVGREEAEMVAARARARVGQEPPRFPSGDRVKLAAAWLIERAGFSKGYALGRARISRKHALALVSDGATTREIVELARVIRAGVRDAFGVTLEPEPVFVACAL